MNVHCVAFISCSLAELEDNSAFDKAAMFCQWDATVLIRRENSGQELQASCPGGKNYSAAYFRSQWIAKHGKL